MAIKRQWHITLTRTDSERVRHINMPLFAGRVVFLFLTLVFVGIAGSVWYVHANQPGIQELNELRTENEHLRQQLRTFSAQLDSINQRLSRFQHSGHDTPEQSPLTISLPPVPSYGAGGFQARDSITIDNEADLGDSYHDTLSRLVQLKQTCDDYISCQEQKLQEIELRRDVYRHTPSIHPTYGRFTDYYGWRRHPITRKRDFHSGLDIANRRGTPVYATADGVVRKRLYQRFIGRMLEIEHGYGYRTRFGHLHNTFVKAGDVVRKGQLIGLMGNTGRSTGPHLHYEVIHNGKHKNPYQYLNLSEQDIVLDDALKQQDRTSLLEQSVSR